MKFITSTSNNEVKSLVQLIEKPSERRKSGYFTVEGKREILLALKAGYTIEKIYFNHDLVTPEELNNFLQDAKISGLPEMVEVAPHVLKKLVYRENSGGLLALCKKRSLVIGQLVLPSNPLIVVLDNIEKPGNIGGILRTCDAAGVDAVLVCDMQTDLLNPNTIRSSLGSVFTNTVVECTGNEAVSFLQSKGIQIFVTHLEASASYHTQDYSKPSAIVFGSESSGVGKLWEKPAYHRIIIPMWGSVNSMNVSVSAAIVVYEAVRQRKL